MTNSRSRGITIASVLLALLYLLAGGAKLGGAQVEQFELWGYPAWLQYLIGVGEVAAGVGFLVKRTRFLAAAAAIVIMVGAIYTVVANDEVDPTLAVPVAALLLAAWVAKESRGPFARPGRRPETQR